LTVTRDYGTEVMISRTVDGLTESTTAMRVLDEAAEIETRYGGGFVQSLDGVAGSTGARSSDWFYFVNGISAERGAAEFEVRPGDRMWWDYRDWTDAMDVNAVVGSYPAPMVDGYDGRRWPVELGCAEATGRACATVRQELADEGVETVADGGGGALRMLVGDWEAVSSDPDCPPLESAPSASGVFARFSMEDGITSLTALDVRGRPLETYGPGTGLIAAYRRGDEPPVWLVTGTDDRGVGEAASALGEDNLKNRYAALVRAGEVVPVP
jgi:hypothetical protein